MSGSVKNFAVPLSATAGAALDTLNMEQKTIQLTGTFVATIQFQGTIDGTNWVNEGAALTAPGVIEVTKRWCNMRANVTAYTSGTPLAKIAAGLTP